jgi:hypothetical protein
MRTTRSTSKGRGHPEAREPEVPIASATLRDYFAGQALPHAQAQWERLGDPDQDKSLMDGATAESFKWADSMMRSRAAVKAPRSGRQPRSK